MKIGRFETRAELEHFVRELYASTTTPRRRPAVARYCRTTPGVVEGILRKGLKCPLDCPFCIPQAQP